MAGKYSCQTVRLVAHMDGAVDEEMLKEAVYATRKRYPYLCVRLCIVLDAQGAERYAYEDNPLPWVLTRGQQQGKAAMGAAERYIREIRTEGNSPLALLVEVSAAGGTFCISFIQQFATDVYLDAFLNELGRMGLSYEIVARHPLSTAPIEDFRKNSKMEKQIHRRK